MITYRIDSIVSIIDDNRDLVQAHWDEIKDDQPNTLLAVKDSKYKWLEDNNHLAVYTAYEDHKMVGYTVWCLLEAIHSSDLHAENDCIYVKPEYRSLGVGRNLIEISEDNLKRQGVAHIGITMKNYAPFEGLVTSLGYELTELVYSKYLG